MRCPVCETQIKPELIKGCGQYRVNRCPSCDVFFADPMKNPGSGWYENSEMYAVGRVLHTTVGWHHRQFLDDPVMYGKRLLDVGCGPGAFLGGAKKKGYDVCGLDFDKGNVKVAREAFGIEHVFVKSVEELTRDFSMEKFDVITFFEVLEHLDEPVRFMSQIKELLKPGGHIALSLPNRDRVIDPLGDGDDPPNHLTKWNRGCLTRFVEKNGFEVVKCSVKTLDAAEAAGYLKSRIRFGIAKGMARKGIDTKNEGEIRKAANLMRLKDAVFKAVSVVFLPLPLLSLQGTGLYLLARMKR